MVHVSFSGWVFLSFPACRTPGDFSPRMKQRFPSVHSSSNPSLLSVSRPSTLWQLGPLVSYLDPNRPKKASQTLQAVDGAGPGHSYQLCLACEPLPLAMCAKLVTPGVNSPRELGGFGST